MISLGTAIAEIFPSRTGSARWPSNVRTHCREISSEDFEWVTSKTLRDTAATAIEPEFGAEAAAAQLGHSAPDVPRMHYIDRAHEALDNRAALDGFDPFPSHERHISPDLKVIADYCSAVNCWSRLEESNP